MRAILAGVGQAWSSLSRAGNREVQHREIEPSGLWRRAFDRADEALRDELELAAHPDEAMRLVVFVLAQGAVEHALDGIAEHTG